LKNRPANFFQECINIILTSKIRISITFEKEHFTQFKKAILNIYKNTFVHNILYIY